MDTGPAAVELSSLSKTYGRHVALVAVDLRVERGQVFGYLGPNGAGKTTTIRLLVGLMRPTSGTARVLGLDSVRQREDLQRLVGYLPGDFLAYPSMTAEEYLRYLAQLRGGVEWAQVRRLSARLELPLDRKIASLSHGNRQKVGIVQALMHRPALVVLDEPTSGLDPLVQREFLQLLREVRDDGRTVLLSSHVLSEVEAVADAVAILRAGRVVTVQSVEGLKSRSLRALELTFRGRVPREEIAAADGVREVLVLGTTAHVTLEGSTAALLEAAAPHHVERIVTHEADLEDVFLDYYQEAAR